MSGSEFTPISELSTAVFETSDGGEEIAFAHNEKLDLAALPEGATILMRQTCPYCRGGGEEAEYGSMLGYHYIKGYCFCAECDGTGTRVVELTKTNRS